MKPSRVSAQEKNAQGRPTDCEDPREQSPTQSKLERK